MQNMPLFQSRTSDAHIGMHRHKFGRRCDVTMSLQGTVRLTLCMLDKILSVDTLIFFLIFPRK